jgi:hypothetical protein
VLGVTGNSLNFYRVMLQQINHVVMVDSGLFKGISFSHNKTDKQDSCLSNLSTRRLTISKKNIKEELPKEAAK